MEDDQAEKANKIQVRKEKMQMISAKKLIYKTIQKIASMAGTISSHTSTISSHTSTLSTHTTKINSLTTTVNTHTTQLGSGTVDGRISAKYIVDDFTSSATSIAAGSGADVQISVAKSGYSKMGIVQVSKSGTNNGHCCLSHFYIDSSDKAHLYYKNTGSAAASITVAVQVLFKKN